MSLLAVLHLAPPYARHFARFLGLFRYLIDLLSRLDFRLPLHVCQFPVALTFHVTSHVTSFLPEARAAAARAPLIGQISKKLGNPAIPLVRTLRLRCSDWLFL